MTHNQFEKLVRTASKNALIILDQTNDIEGFVDAQKTNIPVHELQEVLLELYKDKKIESFDDILYEKENKLVYRILKKWDKSRFKKENE